ncbi:MAG: ribosome recycling factor [Candidatus Omnitrophica bacterium]|nr:ribosome recycling factor [Candidatus Omnitrophota bacterium]MBU4478878.1 ribosome recycling factor [Candidatus Omnitrophota bacterium]MCG2702968.1 ribosome recycling factor [Candidatus Omnitrophota bacterium]
MNVKDIIHQTEDKMKKSVEVTMRDFSTVRTGRASSALVEGIRVDYYGTPTPLKQLAGISTPEARLIVIQPWDPSCIGAIEKAILKSELGITPSNDGKVLRLSVPALTKERRGELVKLVNKLSEEGRVAVRAVRRESNEQLKESEKKHVITEDENFKGQDDIQKLTDKYIKQIDDLLKQKENEIMEV